MGKKITNCTKRKQSGFNWKWPNVAIDCVCLCHSQLQTVTVDSISKAVAACHKHSESVQEAGLCGWVRRSMGEPQIWSALMSLFGPQLCVCLWRLKSIRNLLGVRAPLRLRWLCASERPEWSTSTSFSPQSGGCEAIRLHRTVAWRGLKHQNMLPKHPERGRRGVAGLKKIFRWRLIIWHYGLCDTFCRFFFLVGGRWVGWWWNVWWQPLKHINSNITAVDTSNASFSFLVYLLNRLHDNKQRSISVQKS